MVGGAGRRRELTKIGLELLARRRHSLARELKAQGKSVFLDLETARYRRDACARTAALAGSGCDPLTSTPSRRSGRRRAGPWARARPWKILAVTVLTSLTDADLAELARPSGRAIWHGAPHRPGSAAGVDGIVSSPHEAGIARSLADAAGRAEFLIVTPGCAPNGRPRTTSSAPPPRPARLAGRRTHLGLGPPDHGGRPPRGGVEGDRGDGGVGCFSPLMRDKGSSPS